jgi:hypothetical protein
MYEHHGPGVCSDRELLLTLARERMQKASA